MRSPKRLEPLIDHAALAGELDAFVTEAGAGSGGGPAVRARVLARLKEVRAEVRGRVETLLLDDRSGLAAAGRLSRAQDDLIRVLYDFVLAHVYPATNPSTAEHMAVIAVGGYGRATLAPGSDIDLLFLLPYKQTPWGESVIEYLLYMLWDLGLKVGHATRNIDECVRLSRSDLTIRTALLEARFVYGDRGLFETLTRRFGEEVVKGSSAEYIKAKLAERDDRLRRHGGTRYVVEPNIKEGKGGLRDLQTLFWIAKYHYRVTDTADLIAAGVLSRAEYLKFRRAEDFLWAVRCHLHFVAGRAEERMSFDLQREIARRLGYQERAGLRAVERFMKHYFLVAKDVGDLTLILCAALEEHHAKQAPALNRLIGRFRRGRHASLADGPFTLDHDRINITSPDVFERDPVNLIRIFHRAGKENLAFHPDAMKLVARSLKLIDDRVRHDPEANRLFLELLTSRSADVETVLRRMNEAGVLGRFIPEFGRVVAMMQFNMYHHYTVDEHLIRTVGELAAIDKGNHEAELPLIADIMPGVTNRRALYVAAFLHDIAKGRPEDHSILGAQLARRLCPRLGLTPAETDTVAWLVETHLVMSVVATTRDLNDRKTIADFAAVAQSPERLKLLLILTVADIRAVGPGVFTGWKGQLLRTLYYEAEPYLAGGHSQISRDLRVKAAKIELADALVDWGDADKAAYVERHYPPYWLRVDLASKIEHAGMIRAADRAGRMLASEVRPLAFEGVTRVTVLADDHPRLLSIIAGACAAAGANIVDAQIYTTTDGRALDTISVSRQFDDDGDELRRGQRVSALIERALAGKERLPDVIEKRAVGARARTKAFHLPTDVIVNNSWSDRFTVIEVSGLDRPGLLYDLTRAISDLNLNIGSAHVMTFGEKAVDVFYVTDLTGQRVEAKARVNTIRDRLTAAFDGAAGQSGAASGTASAGREPSRAVAH
jgi:[protein-PII] uridylyltransferase